MGKLKPSSDPVPHNGTLYSAKLTIDGFGGAVTRRSSSASVPGLSPASSTPPLSGGASNGGKLYFDVVGDVPNSVVFNDGTRDLLAWVPGNPGSTAAPVVVPDSDEDFQVVPDNQVPAAAPPSGDNSAIVATPERSGHLAVPNHRR